MRGLRRFSLALRLFFRPSERDPFLLSQRLNPASNLGPNLVAFVIAFGFKGGSSSYTQGFGLASDSLSRPLATGGLEKQIFGSIQQGRARQLGLDKGQKPASMREEQRQQAEELDQQRVRQNLDETFGKW